jgi:hypothetical protein
VHEFVRKLLSMDFGDAAALWANYQARGVRQDLAPGDTMYTGGPKWYWSVGEGAARAVLSAAIAAKTPAIKTVMDFGCGWGRCARHLSALFPDADLLFCELNEPAAEFCARTFSGSVVRSDALPASIDAIWAGSVFTHIDLERARPLLSTLFDSLAPGGVLVATFNGRRAIALSKHQPYIGSGKWPKIMDSYETRGDGYASYDREDLGDYGVSLTKAARIAEICADRHDIRLLALHEGGWANHQDIAVWTRAPLA